MFEDILEEQSVPEKEPNDSATIRAARRLFSNILRSDPDLMRAYRDNVAMRLYDSQEWYGKPGILERGDFDKFLDLRDKETRDEIAQSILDLLFGE